MTLTVFAISTADLIGMGLVAVSIGVVLLAFIYEERRKR